MNTLKFRAWHKERKKYYEVTGIDWTANFVHYIEGYLSEVAIIRSFTFDEVIIEQYTGLKNKSGEMYVGDIVDTHDDEYSSSKGYIYFEKGCFVLNDLDGFTYGNLNEFDFEGFTTIGNIHENKELL